MNVEELRTVQRTERQKDSLQHLRDSFYRDVAEYIAERKHERERAAEQADDPFSSPEVSRLTDEIETAEEVVESVYERRVGKIVKRATFAAAGMATEDEGLTHEERNLFEDLVTRIETNRETVLDTLAGAANAGSDESAPDADPEIGVSEPDSDTDPTPPTEADESPGPAPNPDDLLAEAMGGDGDPAPTDAVPSEAATTAADSAPESPTSTETADDPTPDGGSAVTAPSQSTPEAGTETDTDRTTLRITRDVGEIFGVDEREYDLVSEDVVTLPTPNAEPLLERDAAERLDAE